MTVTLSVKLGIVCEKVTLPWNPVKFLFLWIFISSVLFTNILCLPEVDNDILAYLLPKCSNKLIIHDISHHPVVSMWQFVKNTSITRGTPDPDLDLWIRIWPDIRWIWWIEVRSGSGWIQCIGKYWPDLHNYDIKHHSMFSFQEMTHDITELYTKTH